MLIFGNMPISNLIEGINAELRANFETKADAISHSQQKGEAREEALRELLGTYLPERCGVSTGFVIDSNGYESNQIDIIVYDRMHTPVFQIADSKQFFPCETVIAVGEVKSKIDSQELEDAIEKITSVKTLSRFGAPIITGPGRNLQGEELSAHNYRDQIFGFIFTADSLTKENLVSEYYNQIAEIQERLWPNYYCDYNNFNIGYSTGEYYSYDPNDAKGFYVADDSNILFALFFTMLVQFINEAHIARPDLAKYYDVHILEPDSDAELYFFPID